MPIRRTACKPEQCQAVRTSGPLLFSALLVATLLSLKLALRSAVLQVKSDEAACLGEGGASGNRVFAPSLQRAARLPLPSVSAAWIAGAAGALRGTPPLRWCCVRFVLRWQAGGDLLSCLLLVPPLLLARSLGSAAEPGAPSVAQQLPLVLRGRVRRDSCTASNEAAKRPTCWTLARRGSAVRCRALCTVGLSGPQYWTAMLPWRPAAVIMIVSSLRICVSDCCRTGAQYTTMSSRYSRTGISNAMLWVKRRQLRSTDSSAGMWLQSR